MPFSSTASRFSEFRSEGPDPGAYNPQSSFATAGKSHSRSSSTGRGGFGSSGSRDLPWTGQREEKPHPAAAEAAKRAASPGRARPATADKKSSAFASGSSRFAARKEATPGPGEYSDRAPLADRNGMKRSASFGASKSSRFAADRTSCASNPGPGEYAARGAFDKSSKDGCTGASAAFASKSSARQLPGHQGAEGTGGEYVDLGSTFSKKATSKSGSSAFADSSSRFLKPMVGAGADVGSYNPDQNSIASQARKSQNRAQTSGGSGGFGSSAARPPLSAVNDAPGPGAYDSNSLGSRSQRGAGSSFKSTSSRFASPSRRGVDSAAPGDYDPHSNTGMGAVKSTSSAARSGNAGFGSKTKRSIPGTGEAAATPAPGAYGQHQNSISARSRTMSSSAGFASNSMRDLPWE